MKPTLRRVVVVVAKLVAFGAASLLLARALASADWAAAGASLRVVGPAVLLVLVPPVLGLLLEAAAWARLFARLRDATPSLARLFRVRFATEALSIGLPAGGLVSEAVAPYLLAGTARLPSALATGAVKRWLIIRTHGLYVVCAAVVGHAMLSRRGLVAAVALSGAALVLGSVGIERASRLGIGARVSAAATLLRRSRLLGWIARDTAPASIARVDVELALLGASRHVIATALIFLQWLLEAASSWLILRLLGGHVAFTDVFVIDATLSVLRAAAVFAPAGLGVQDLGTIALFDALGLHGVAPAFLVLKRGKELVVLAVGLLFLFSPRLRGKARCESPAVSPR